MKVGPFNERCLIEYPVTTQDDEYGTDEITWTTLGARWCNTQDVLPSRSESVKQGLAVALNQTRLRLRYCTDIDSSMRVTLYRPGAQTFSIIAGPAVLGDKDAIEFMLEKVSS